MDKKSLVNVIGEFVRFTGVGVLSTLCHYAVFGFGIAILEGHTVFWSVAGSMVGAIIGYTLNYLFTFKSNISILSGGLRYFVMVLIGIALNGLFMSFFTYVFIINAWIAQIISTAIVFFFNFAMSKLWVFKAA